LNIYNSIEPENEFEIDKLARKSCRFEVYCNAHKFIWAVLEKNYILQSQSMI